MKSRISSQKRLCFPYSHHLAFKLCGFQTEVQAWLRDAVSRFNSCLPLSSSCMVLGKLLNFPQLPPSVKWREHITCLRGSLWWLWEITCKVLKRACGKIGVHSCYYYVWENCLEFFLVLAGIIPAASCKSCLCVHQNDQISGCANAKPKHRMAPLQIFNFPRAALPHIPLMKIFMISYGRKIYLDKSVFWLLPSSPWSPSSFI